MADPQTTVRADAFADETLDEFVAIALDYLEDRKNIYCACFEGGTFCCVDCSLSHRTRVIHEIMKGVENV